MAFDPVRLEVMQNALGSVADEMILTVVRIAYSSIMKDTMDLSATICDRNGLMIAQGHGLPGHMGSIPDAMEAVLHQFPEGLAEGDVVILNDPYHGGMHLPDIFMFKPSDSSGWNDSKSLVSGRPAKRACRAPESRSFDNRPIEPACSLSSFAPASQTVLSEEGT